MNDKKEERQEIPENEDREERQVTEEEAPPKVKRYRCPKHGDEIITNPFVIDVPELSPRYSRFNGIYCPLCLAQFISNVGSCKKLKPIEE